MTMFYKNDKNKYQEIEKIKRLVKGIDPQHSVSDRQGEFLYNTAKKCLGKGVIVEIGSWKGRSTIWLGRGSKAGSKVNIYAIDPHTGSPVHKQMYGEVQTFKEFEKNIKRAKIDDVVVPIVKTSEEAEKDWKSQPIEFLWIDGNHNYEFVKLDFDKWSPYLVEGGVIAFHDTVHSPEVRRVIIEDIFKSRNFIDIGLVGSITFAKKVEKSSLKDRLKNRHALFLRYTYESFSKIKWYLLELIIKIKTKIIGSFNGEGV